MENFATIWEIGGQNMVDALDGVWLRDMAYDQGV
jgi:hypothetical protein